MNLRAPYVDPKFQSLRQGPLEMSWDFSLGSCSQAWRPPPPSLRWGTSRAPLQTRDGDPVFAPGHVMGAPADHGWRPRLCAGARHGCSCRPGVTPGHLLCASWRDERGWVSKARQRQAHFPFPVKLCRIGTCGPCGPCGPCDLQLWVLGLFHVFVFSLLNS